MSGTLTNSGIVGNSSFQPSACSVCESSSLQKVAVEHVHIHRGGQAIVGAVNNTNARGGGGDDKKEQR